ncbi:MAG TPA: DUF4365 domain-containing protein [Edaphobacter sp.]|nr:DUF4365 domain-containing protein [Edaphobacter sp.]
MPLPLNQIKEELSYAYIHAIAARAGFACDRPQKDYESLDVMISSQGAVSFDSIRHNAQLGFQLKATSAEVLTDTPEFTYPLPIKNYNDLRLPSTIPRLLVVYVMPQDSSHWLTYHEPEEHLIQRRCAYWLDLFGSQEVSNETSRTISIPRCNVLTVEALTTLMARASRLEIGHV